MNYVVKNAVYHWKWLNKSPPLIKQILILSLPGRISCQFTALWFPPLLGCSAKRNSKKWSQPAYCRRVLLGFVSIQTPRVRMTRSTDKNRNLSEISGIFEIQEHIPLPPCVYSVHIWHISINTSRGQVVKQNELIEALKNDDVSVGLLFSFVILLYSLAHIENGISEQNIFVFVKWKTVPNSNNIIWYLRMWTWYGLMGPDCLCGSWRMWPWAPPHWLRITQGTWGSLVESVFRNCELKDECLS